MDLRRLFARAHVAGGLSMTELCEHCGISRKTGYTWAARSEHKGLEGLVNVAAFRTQRAVVFYVRDPGHGFSTIRLPPGFDGRSTADPEFVRHEAGDHGYAEAYRLLVARTIVDEMLYNERANEVILITHLA